MHYACQMFEHATFTLDTRTRLDAWLRLEFGDDVDLLGLPIRDIANRLQAECERKPAQDAPPTGRVRIEWTSAGTLKGFAKDMNMHRNTLRKLIQDGTVPHKRLGKLYQIPIDKLAPVHQAKYRPKD